MTRLNKDKQPRAAKEEIHRLSENGGGAVQWGLETDFSLSDVLAPGFFQLVGKHGFQKHDRIYVVCRRNQSVVTHTTLAVRGSHYATGIEVAQLGEAFEVEIGHMTPFERLGLPMTANKVEIDIAFRKMSMTLHPDKGGKKSAMQALNKAREEAMIIAINKEQEQA